MYHWKLLNSASNCGKVPISADNCTMEVAYFCRQLYHGDCLFLQATILWRLPISAGNCIPWRLPISAGNCTMEIAYFCINCTVEVAYFCRQLYRGSCLFLQATVPWKLPISAGKCTVEVAYFCRQVYHGGCLFLQETIPWMLPISAGNCTAASSV